MKKNKYIKTVKIITIFLICLSFCLNIYGFTTDSWKPGDMSGGTVINNLGNMIVNAVRIVGSAISVITILIIGIKYMTGSVEEKAEYKKSMIPYVIGAVMVFGISHIVAILYDLGTSLG